MVTLLDKLTLMKQGAHISGINVTCPAYADDITLVALHKPCLQLMIDTVCEHSQMWRYKFNPQKTKIIVFGKDDSFLRRNSLWTKHQGG